METSVATRQDTESAVMMGFGTASGFDLMQRAAKLLASSELVPKEYQGKIANCTIALEMAARIGASPLMVMQNLYLVHGRPSWSSQFITAAINSTGKFSPLRFQLTGSGDDRTCIAWATDKMNGERLESPPVSIGMAKKEGWFDRNGSKWKTMPELMLRYRSATFFGRLYAPEVLMGMKADDEVIDIEGEDITPRTATIDIPEIPETIPPTVEDFNASIPEGTDTGLLKVFIDRQAEHHKKTVDEFKVEAAKDIPGFWKFYGSWQTAELKKKAKKNEDMSPAECPDAPGTTYKKSHCQQCAKFAGCPVWN